MSMRIRINSEISALFRCISPNYAFLSGGDCNKLHKVKKTKHKKVVHPWGGGATVQFRSGFANSTAARKLKIKRCICGVK